jgi:hypothetical protein
MRIAAMLAAEFLHQVLAEYQKIEGNVQVVQLSGLHTELAPDECDEMDNFGFGLPRKA